MKVMISDFDGTPTPEYVAWPTLMRFTDDRWKRVERDFRKGKIGSRVALVRQFSLVNENKDDMIRFVDSTVSLDPCLLNFLSLCEEQGLDFYIPHILGGYGLKIPDVAKKTTFVGKSITLELSKEEVGRGMCKRHFLRGCKEMGRWVICNDANTCPAALAEVVFAENELPVQCEKRKIGCFEFHSLAVVVKRLSG